MVLHAFLAHPVGTVHIGLAFAETLARLAELLADLAAIEAAAAAVRGVGLKIDAGAGRAVCQPGWARDAGVSVRIAALIVPAAELPTGRPTLRACGAAAKRRVANLDIRVATRFVPAIELAAEPICRADGAAGVAATAARGPFRDTPAGARALMGGGSAAEPVTSTVGAADLAPVAAGGNAAGTRSAAVAAGLAMIGEGGAHRIGGDAAEQGAEQGAEHGASWACPCD